LKVDKLGSCLKPTWAVPFNDVFTAKVVQAPEKFNVRGTAASALTGQPRCSPN